MSARMRIALDLRSILRIGCAGSVRVGEREKLVGFLHMRDRLVLTLFIQEPYRLNWEGCSLPLSYNPYEPSNQTH